MGSRRRLVLPPEIVQERFWDKVDVDGEECWLWRAATRVSDGMGVFGIEGVIFYAHRVAFVITRGEIPDGYDVRRTCRNPLCVRPLHLCLAPRGRARCEDETPASETTRWLI